MSSIVIRVATVWTLTCAAVLVSIPAHAQAPRAAAAHADPRPWARGVAAREQQLALALFAAGNREFVEERFSQALARYREAIRHWDHPAIRFNMAKCLINLDQPVEANDNLERGMAYGVAPLGPDLHSQGLTYRKLLDAQLVRVKVSCPEPEAVVTLDGKLLFVGPGTIEQITLPGEHQVVATKGGFATASERFVLVAGKPGAYEIRPSTGLGGGTAVPCGVSSTQPSYFSDWSQRMAAVSSANKKAAATPTLPLAISVPTSSAQRSAISSTSSLPQPAAAQALPPKTSAPWPGAEVYLQPTPPPSSASSLATASSSLSASGSGSGSGPGSGSGAAGSPTPYASTAGAGLPPSSTARVGSSAAQGASQPSARGAAGVPTMLTANVAPAGAAAGVAPVGAAASCVPPACVTPGVVPIGGVPGGVVPGGVVPGGVVAGVGPAGVLPGGVAGGVAPGGIAAAGVVPPGAVPSSASLSAPPAPPEPMLFPSASPPLYVPPTPPPYVGPMPYLRPPYTTLPPQSAGRGAPNPVPGWAQKPPSPGTSPGGPGMPGAPQSPGPAMPPAPPDPFATAANAHVPVPGASAARPGNGSVVPPSAHAAATDAPSTAALAVSSTAVAPAPPSPPANHRPAIIDDENPLLTPPPYRALAASPYRGPAPVAPPSSAVRAPSAATHPPSGSTSRAPVVTGAPSGGRGSSGAMHPRSEPWYRAPAVAAPSSSRVPSTAPAPHAPAPAPTYHAPAPTYHAPAPTYHR